MQPNPKAKPKLKPKKKRKLNKRRLSRVHAMQALYQWEFTQLEPEILVEEFLFEQNLKANEVDLEYFQALLSGALDHVKSIDTLMSAHIDRDISQLNPVELAVLRLGIFELAYRKEVPYAVAINEAIELAKDYGSADGHKFVNGVLNAILPKLRAAEVASK